MSLITDSCSLINLVKAELDAFVRQDTCVRLCAGPIVQGEVWAPTSIGRRVPRDLVHLLTDDVDVEEFAALMFDRRIGPGESESILLAQRYGFYFFSDDRRARVVASDILGADRVTGTFGLAIQQARVVGDIAQAFNGYSRAVRDGAFLPAHSLSSFQTSVRDARPWPCGQECRLT